MRKSFVLISLLVLASMLLAACGGGAVATQPPSTGATQAPSTGSETPKSKDPTTFTVAEPGLSIDTLDPALAYDTASSEILQNVYETLIFYDGQATDKFVPLLAESYEPSADGKTWTFHIRKGVKFHNGDELTPTDVAYSFQRGLLQSGSVSPQWLLSEPFFGVGNQDIVDVVIAKLDDKLGAKLDELVGAADLTKFDAAAFGTLFTDYATAYTQASGFAVDAAKVVADEANKKTIDDMIAGLAKAADDNARKDAIKTAVTDILGAAEGGDLSGLYDTRDALVKVDPAVLKEVGQMAIDAIVPDDAAGTVTMNLAQSWGPFLPTIAQSWGSVMDKKWVIENKGWDGTPETWQNFYGMQSADDPLSGIENGTGPFKLDGAVKQGEEYDLVRNDSYWREPAKLQRIIVKDVEEWGTRFTMLQTGDADVATVQVADRSQADEYVGETCEFDLATNSYKPCEVTDASKPLRLLKGRPQLQMDVLGLNWKIATSEESPNPYLGSGKLDGNGIPSDFFADVHVRKAFAYCFDYDTLINDVFNGDAVQAIGLPLPGMPGYFPDIPHYNLDLDKCASEFKLADLDKDGIPAGDDQDGDVWTTGFRIQMAYNQGSNLRQTIAEILAQNLAQVNDKFSLETLGLPWASYLRAQRAAQLPILTAGWLEDIHDPHNWYQPYTLGAYASRFGLSTDIKNQFKDILARGVAETDPAKRAEIYKEANQLFYDQAVGIPLEIPTQHAYRQRWVQGEILNPLFTGFIYYTITKD